MSIDYLGLKIILGNEYIDYKTALMKFSLSTLSERRDERLERFALKCIQDKFNKSLFPLNTNVKNREYFQVNFARTTKYCNRTVPQCQRLLNDYAKNHPISF